MSSAEWLVLAGGVVLIALVNWWFFGDWPQKPAGGHVHHH